MAEQDTGTAQATAQDGTGQAGGEGQGTQEQEGGEAGKAKPFTPEQEAYIGSWLGRISKTHVKKEVEETILPYLRQQIQPPPTGTPNDGLKQFEEEVQNLFFSGKAVEAVDKILRVKEQAQQNLTQAQNMNLLRGITTYSDQPYYEDIHSEMQKLAKEKISEGAPVDKALKWAYVEAKANFLEQKLTGGDRDASGLALSSGGRRTERTKTVKLTEAEEAACARDIRDGYYKNKEDWMKARSQKIPTRVG